MRFGFTFHQYPEKDEDVLQKLFAPGPGRINAGLVLDGDAQYYIGKYDWPGMEWVIRLYDYAQSNIYGRGPEWTASAISGIIQKWEPILGSRAHYQFDNEINLEGENGGALPSFEQRTAFHMRVIELVHNWHPNAILVAPEDSPGHEDVDGREEIKKYEPLWRQLAAADGEGGFHFYADHDAGGFQPETLYAGASTHNRAFVASQWLDDMGLPASALGRTIDETNEKDPDRRTMRDFPPYARKLKAAGFRRVLWFPWSSGDFAHDNLAMHRICREPDFVDWCRGLIAELASDEVVVIPLPVVLPPAGEPDAATAALITKYNLTLIPRAGLKLVLAEAPEGQLELMADGPPDMMLKWHNNDKPNDVEGLGHIELQMQGSSWYNPGAGECGQWTLDVDGIPYLKCAGMQGGTNHHHANATVSRETVVTPPTGGNVDTERINGWDVSFGFLAAYKASPDSIGLPIGPMVSSGQFGSEAGVAPERQRQMQYFEHATMYYDNAGVVVLDYPK